MHWLARISRATLSNSFIDGATGLPASVCGEASANAPCPSALAKARTAAPEPVAPPVVRGPHTFLWDPLLLICHYLDIARSGLSRLSKEYSGMAAHEIIDRIRAE